MWATDCCITLPGTLKIRETWGEFREESGEEFLQILSQSSAQTDRQLGFAKGGGAGGIRVGSYAEAQGKHNKRRWEKTHCGAAPVPKQTKPSLIYAYSKARQFSSQVYNYSMIYLKEKRPHTLKFFCRQSRLIFHQQLVVRGFVYMYTVRSGINHFTTPNSIYSTSFLPEHKKRRAPQGYTPPPPIPLKVRKRSQPSSRSQPTRPQSFPQRTAPPPPARPSPTPLSPQSRSRPLPKPSSAPPKKRIKKGQG